MKTEKQPLPFLVKGKIWKNLPNFGVLHYFQSAAEEFRYSTFLNTLLVMWIQDFTHKI